MEKTVAKSRTITHRWGWDVYRIGWAEGTPRFTISVAKKEPIFIDLDDLEKIQGILEELNALYFEEQEGKKG